MLCDVIKHKSAEQKAKKKTEQNKNELKYKNTVIYRKDEHTLSHRSRKDVDCTQQAQSNRQKIHTLIVNNNMRKKNSHTRPIFGCTNFLRVFLLFPFN